MYKVAQLFMEDNDEKALQLLYEITKDNLCNILINWKKEYNEYFQDSSTNEFYMYEDLISYLWDKYNIGGE